MSSLVPKATKEALVSRFSEEGYRTIRQAIELIQQHPPPPDHPPEDQIHISRQIATSRAGGDCWEANYKPQCWTMVRDFLDVVRSIPQQNEEKKAEHDQSTAIISRQKKLIRLSIERRDASGASKSFADWTLSHFRCRNSSGHVDDNAPIDHQRLWAVLGSHVGYSEQDDRISVQVQGSRGFQSGTSNANLVPWLEYIHSRLLDDRVWISVCVSRIPKPGPDRARLFLDHNDLTHHLSNLRFNVWREDLNGRRLTEPETWRMSDYLDHDGPPGRIASEPLARNLAEDLDVFTGPDPLRHDRFALSVHGLRWEVADMSAFETRLGDILERFKEGGGEADVREVDLIVQGPLHLTKTTVVTKSSKRKR